MRIAVYGTGGVGGYFGARLAEAGEAVSFIARGPHLAVLRERGLQLDSPAGAVHLEEVRASDDPAEVGAVDVVLVGVKAWQVAEAARAMGPLLAPDTFVVPLQNGVEAPERLAEVLGRERVLGGLCGLIAHLAAPGRISHVGADPFVEFGELDGGSSERTEALRRAFGRARGVRATVPDDIRAAMWRKFLLIASWSGAGSVTRAPIGVLRSLPETRELLVALMREVRAVAVARGIDLRPEAIDGALAFLDGLPAAGTASMQRDLADGRRSELDDQNGAVVRLGREAEVATPANAFVYAALLPLELQARGHFAADWAATAGGASAGRA